MHSERFYFAIYSFMTNLKCKRRKKMNKKKVLGVGILVALVVVLGLLYGAFKEKPVAGSKAITIEVVNSEGEVTSYELQTDAEYLQQAMDEADGLEYSGTEGDYGMMIDTVNGEKAVFEETGAYWGFYVNDDYCNYGISEQPVEDGDVFQIVYTLSE